MICKNCGETILEGAAFCANCGSKIEKTLVDENVAEPVATAPIVATIETVSNTGDEPPPATVMELSPKSVSKRIVRAVLSVLLALLAFVFVFTFIALLIVRPSNIPQIIATADVLVILEDTGLSDEIISDMNNSNVTGIEIDSYRLRDFLRRGNVSGEVGKIAERYVTAVMDGDYEYYISAREIVSFLRAISSDIRDEFDYRLTNEDYESITNTLNTDVNLKDYRIGKLLDDAGVDYAMPYLLLSAYPIIIIGILSTLLIFNIFMLHKRKVRAAFLIVSIPIALSGLICTVVGLLIGPFSGLFSGSGIYSFIRIASGAASAILILGLIAVMLGGLLLTVFFLIGRFRKQRPSKTDDVKIDNLWRITALISNVSMMVLCFSLSLICYLNLP
ncbi:MAG: zinc ribbon domain-containing protein [Oscillospiraceae bacterium]|nr:zinc ribbon domain-containing protein [Oscillospiraceae bacterium]